MVYKRVLNAEERAWLYNNGRGRSYAEVAPTSRQLDAVAKARAQYREVMARWAEINAASR